MNASPILQPEKDVVILSWIARRTRNLPRRRGRSPSYSEGSEHTWFSQHPV